MTFIQQAIEFYKSLGGKILQNISFKDIFIKILLSIIILFLVNTFPNTANNIRNSLQKMINILLIIDIIIIILKIIYSIYKYKTTTFNNDDEKKEFKRNQIIHIKESIYGFLEIGLGRFIISFVFYSIGFIAGNNFIPDINLPRLEFIAVTLFTIMCFDANIIIFSNIFNKTKKAFGINYILYPIIFLLLITLYLHIIY